MKNNENLVERLAARGVIAIRSISGPLDVIEAVWLTHRVYDDCCYCVLASEEGDHVPIAESLLEHCYSLESTVVPGEAFDLANFSAIRVMLRDPISVYSVTCNVVVVSTKPAAVKKSVHWA